MHLHKICQDQCGPITSRPCDDAPGHRDGHARGGGIAERQAFEAARRQEAESLGFDGIRRPSQRLGRFGNSGTTRAIAAAVNAVSVAAPSGADTSRRMSLAKSLRSSDFGGGKAKKGSFSACAIQASSTLPWEAMRPSQSKSWPSSRYMKSLSSALPGP